jgi:leucyl/phenylalanyl-tRNA--protein transferase
VNQSRIAWLSPSDPPDSFPDVSLALTEPDGLLAAGGDLGIARLLAAYTHGIFPWFEDGQPILWWSPNPRLVLWPANLHVSRRLRQQLRNSTAELRFNTAFDAVINACAGKRRSQQGTWITSDMISAYVDLHREGWAHSVEVWDDHGLAGGLYGLCIGNVFFGESMFSARPNTSKIAMLGLTRHMQATGIELLDCQVPSPHLLTLGAEFMERADFSAFLARACDPAEPHDAWPDEPVPVSGLFIA